MKLEKYFFYIVLLLNLWPVLSHRYYPTLDGPAHLYNASLVNHMVAHETPNMEAVFAFNPKLVPNWTSHLILSAFLLVSPPHWAEKLFLILYLIGLPLAFRALVRTLAPRSMLGTFLIFPLTYSAIFIYGFYNFSLGLIFFLWSLKFWINNRTHLKGTKLITLCSLMVLTYFTHAAIFGLTWLACGWISLNDFLADRRSRSSMKSSLVRLWGQLWPLALFGIPGLLALVHFSADQDVMMVKYATIAENWKNLIELHPIYALDTVTEGGYARRIAMVVLFLVIVALWSFIRELKRETDGKGWIYRCFSIRNMWLNLTMLFLLLYFCMPNDFGRLGFVSIRFSTVALLSLLIWISGRDLPKWIMVLSLPVIMYYHLRLNEYYSTYAAYLNERVIELEDMSSLVSEDDVVAVLDYSNNWYEQHFSNYLGAQKPMVVMENYECGTLSFPLIWNREAFPRVQMGGLNLGGFQPVFTYLENGPELPADHVLVQGHDEQGRREDQELFQALDKYYAPTYTGKHNRLYSLR